jgi:hypothetical protein
VTSTKYIGMGVHKESISIAVRNAAGKIVVECVIETKASMILQFIDGLRGDVHQFDPATGSTAESPACELRPRALSPNPSGLICGGKNVATPDPDVRHALPPHPRETATTDCLVYSTHRAAVVRRWSVPSESAPHN